MSTAQKLDSFIKSLGRYRVNDVNVIRELFDFGYRIGLNY